MVKKWEAFNRAFNRKPDAQASARTWAMVLPARPQDMLPSGRDANSLCSNPARLTATMVKQARKERHGSAYDRPGRTVLHR